MSGQEQPEQPKRHKAFDLLTSVVVPSLRKRGIALNDPMLVERCMVDAERVHTW